MRKSTTLLAAFAFTGAFRSASADIVNVQALVDGTTGLSGTVSYMGTNHSVLAGSFPTTINSTSSFNSYCVDLFSPFSASTYTGTIHDIQTLTYTSPGVAPPSPANSDKAISYLFNNFNSGATDAVHKTALQIAIWEAEYDYSDTATNHGIGLTNGNFRVVLFEGSTTPSIESDANADLTNIANGTFLSAPTTQLQASFYTNNSTTSGNQQPILTIAAADIPEPGTLSLLAASLTGGAGIFWRRRRKKASPPTVS